jgi:Tol biopolymer transport system component
VRARIVLTAAITAALAAAAPALGAFPGKNGLIAFQKIKTPSSEIYVMGPKGGKERDITNTPRVVETTPAFSPNGRTIAFLWVSFGTSGHQNGGIGVVNSNGTGLKHLTSGNVDTDPYFGPTWSADGRSILYEREKPVVGSLAPVTIWSISPKGGAQRQVTNGSDLFVLASPLGKELAFVHADPNGDPNAPRQLEVTNLSGGNPTVVGAGVAISDWSPDGKRFVYGGPQNAIWTRPVDGGTPTKLVDEPARDEDPAFSPDGRFVIWTNEATHDIWIAKSDGSGARNLTHQPGFEKDPTWGKAAKIKHKHH